MQYASKSKKLMNRATALAFAAGLSAWLGGVAFCIGFGISAPVWVAAVATVLSIAFGRLGAQAQRRATGTPKRLT